MIVTPPAMTPRPIQAPAVVLAVAAQDLPEGSLADLELQAEVRGEAAGTPAAHPSGTVLARGLASRRISLRGGQAALVGFALDRAPARIPGLSHTLLFAVHWSVQDPAGRPLARSVAWFRAPYPQGPQAPRLSVAGRPRPGGGTHVTVTLDGAAGQLPGVVTPRIWLRTRPYP